MSEPCLRENIVSLGEYLCWCMQQYGSSTLLTAHTAYVGFNSVLDTKVNYWYCDGVADNVQINLAEAYVTALGGGTVEFEAGTFDIVDPIIPTGNQVWYKGQGDATFLDGDGLATTEHVFHVTGRDDLRISDMSMQTSDGVGNTSHCIFIEDGSDRFLIENVTILDSDSDGIHVEGTNIVEGHIHNCRILDVDDNGIQINADNGAYVYYLKITECEIAGAGERGILLANGNSDYSYCVIQDNTIHGCTLDGIYAWDLEYSTIGGNTLFDNDNHGIILNSGGRTTVVNNSIMRSGFHGIYLVNMGYCTVDGNVVLLSDFDVTFTYNGINVATGCNYITVSNNQLEGNRRYGIYTGAPNTIIEGNGIALSQEHGIVIDATDCVCSSNAVDDNGQRTAGTYHGIVLTTAADRSTVEGNTCSSPGDSQEDGIQLEDGAANILLEGNYCYDGMGSGIMLIANNDNCSIIGNYLINNDDYGIEIVAATCNNARVKENYFDGNVTGCFSDGGTDTATHEINETVGNTNAYIGRHPVAQMLDNVETTVRFGFTCPMDFQELVTAEVVIVSAAAGDLVWDAFTDWGKICATEDYNTHSDSVGATTTGVLITDLVCLDVSGALDIAALTPGDRVGMEFWRDGDNGSDTIGDTVYVVEVRLRYV